MSGSTYKRCADGADCPDLGRRRHGSWFFATRLSTTSGRLLVRRGGFPLERDAAAALEQVTVLAGIDADKAIAAKIGDMIVAATRRGGQLPSAAAVRLRLGAGLDPASPDMTVAQHLEAWLATGRTVRGRPWKQSVARSYQQHVATYLVPCLGDIAVSRLRAEHIAGMLTTIESWNSQIRQQRAEGRAWISIPGDVRKTSRIVSNATLSRIYATLRTAMSAAVRSRLIMFNPCAGVRPAEAAEHIHNIWSPDEVVAFLEHATAAGDRLVLAWRLVLLLGLRRGEVTGLLWDDLNLDAGRLHIGHEVLSLGGRIVHDTPKSKTSVRDVSIDPDTVRQLRAHRLGQLQERMAAGAAYDDTGLVFCDELGRLYSPDLVSARFKRAAADAGVPVIKLHEGRHTSATLAMESGIDVKRVSARLGHSTTAITSDVYQHVRRPVADADAEAMAALLTRRTAP
jgi:integrase